MVADVLGEEADEAQVAYEERAAIIEYDAGLDRQEAEAAATEELEIACVVYVTCVGVTWSLSRSMSICWLDDAKVAFEKRAAILE